MSSRAPEGRIVERRVMAGFLSSWSSTIALAALCHRANIFRKSVVLGAKTLLKRKLPAFRLINEADNRATTSFSVLCTFDGLRDPKWCMCVCICFISSSSLISSLVFVCLPSHHFNNIWRILYRWMLSFNVRILSLPLLVLKTCSINSCCLSTIASSWCEPAAKQRTIESVFYLFHSCYSGSSSLTCAESRFDVRDGVYFQPTCPSFMVVLLLHVLETVSMSVIVCVYF